MLIDEFRIVKTYKGEGLSIHEMCLAGSVNWFYNAKKINLIHPRPRQEATKTMFETDLETILAAKRRRLARKQEKTPVPAIMALADMQTRPHPFLNVVTDPNERAIIGHIRLDEVYDPVASALLFERAGVSAISLFTDITVYSKGTEDLLLVTRAMKRLPVMSQNYILSVYSLLEARANGVSAVVLYPSILAESLLLELVSLSHRLRMTTVINVQAEAHLAVVEQAMPHAVSLGLGDSFDENLDLPLLESLIPRVPFSVRVLPHGSVNRFDDLEMLLQMPVHAIQIDESLISTPKRVERLQRIMATTHAD